MTYKALNTFIDDIFAFVIKMPTMYRIGCFRDDIVFFIFLYQRYIYRVSLFSRQITIVFPNISSPLFWRIFHDFFLFFQVDHTRVNEFGFSGEMLDEQSKKKSVDTDDQKSLETDKKSLEDKKKD